VASMKALLRLCYCVIKALLRPNDRIKGLAWVRRRRVLRLTDRWEKAPQANLRGN
jgi:hypothetical protein